MGRKRQSTRKQPKARPRGIIELSDRGFGFVATPEGEFFVPPSKTGGAFPGDLVELAVHKADSRRQPRRGAGRSGTGGADGMSGVERDGGRKPEARVVRVLSRAQRRVVGRFQIAEPFGVVVPENRAITHDIFTLLSDAPHIEEGALVEVEMVEYPTRHSAATGRVVRVIGSADAPGIEIDTIIAENDLETTFSQDALEQAEACEATVEAALAEGCLDRRGEFVMTIDPEDARDFDDAVSCRFEDGRFHLSVHIADVSAFVPFDTPLDLAARRRGTSVYLVDRVLPMLPERLSNELCSLQPDQPRRAMSVDAVIRPDGAVESFEVRRCLIESKARLSYEQALCLMDEGDARAARAAFDLAPHPHGANPLDELAFAQAREACRCLDRLAQALFARRYRSGCMDFTRVEARVRVDAECVPLEVEYRTRTRATQAIEEAMVLANSLVAQWLGQRGLPCVHRVHGLPSAEGLRALWPFLQEEGAFKGVSKAGFLAGDPKTLQKVLAIADKLPIKELVSSLLLRSMAQAFYSVDDEPHYGLALEHYCHFTSPIRRYPDLLVHRMVERGLELEGAIAPPRGGVDARAEHGRAFARQKEALAWMAEHASRTERVAEKAARESQTVKLIEYLEGFLYQRFEGIVAGVSTFGLTVRLENTATGLLPTESLGHEPFSFDHRALAVTGVDSGVSWRLGQRVSVRLVEADHARRQLLFDRPQKI